MKKPIKFGGRKRYNGEEDSLVEAAKAEGERSSDEPLEQISKMAQKKKSVVTKEEMQRAGFDNLRDYLNAQRGLTRRGEKPAESKPAASKPAETKAESASLEVRASRLPSPNKPREASGILSSLKEGVTRGGYEFGQEKESPKRSTSEKKPRSTERPEGFLSSFSKAITSGGREFTGGGHEFGKKHGGKVHKYAKGGSVGSASKRADGIAMRGKTRGKMV